MIRDTLLIIDDSELDLAILNEIFKNIFQVECVLDARQALSFLQKHTQQVCGILLDICLERRGAGFTVLHQLQGNPATVDLPVILITTDANEKDVRASVERGAVDFLVKPVDPHTVQERVCNVVRSAWPPQSTILDCKKETETTEPPKDQKPSLQKDPSAQAKELCRVWSRKFEAFCALRPGLDMDAHRQLALITEVLARHCGEVLPEKGLTEEDASLIGLASMFCDIGLLGVPDKIVEQGEDQDGPGAQIYYQHTNIGHELFSVEGESLPLLRYAGEIALWHHKNVDGSGYPVDADPSAIPFSAQLTRTALRIQRYLNYYRGCADGMERTLRMMKNEAGSVISHNLYELACASQDAIQEALQAPRA